VRRLAACCTSLVLVALTSAAVIYETRRNLRDHVYPQNADSIGIPIVESYIASGVLLALLLLAVALAWRNRWLSWLSISLGTVAGGISALSALDWALPKHVLICISYALLSLFCFVVTVQFCRGLASNNTLLRTSAR
jgi:hypothetical protein